MDCGVDCLELTKGGSVEVAPGAVERARRKHVSDREQEITYEGVAPYGVILEEVLEPAAGKGKADQIITA